MMNYNEFKEVLRNEVQKYFETADVQLTTKRKLNNVILDGLTIVPKCAESIRDGVKTTPVVYLREFYERYQSGVGMERIAFTIARILISESVETLVIKEMLVDWKTAKAKIHLQLIKESWNYDMLQELPHKQYLDFAVIFVMELQSTPEEKQSTNVTYELQKMWGVSIEDLWNAGMENLQKEGVAILSIEEITHGLLPEDGLGMYAMTTENMVRGSVSVLSEEVLKKFSEEKKADYYLLPRSIYEWILIEKTDDLDPVYLRLMVIDSNSDPDKVKPEELLSDQVYLYERKTGKVRIA